MLTITGLLPRITEDPFKKRCTSLKQGILSHFQHKSFHVNLQSRRKPHYFRSLTQYKSLPSKSTKSPIVNMSKITPLYKQLHSKKRLILKINLSLKKSQKKLYPKLLPIKTADEKQCEARKNIKIYRMMLDLNRNQNKQNINKCPHSKQEQQCNKYRHRQFSLNLQQGYLRKSKKCKQNVGGNEKRLVTSENQLQKRYLKCLKIGQMNKNILKANCA